MRFRPRSHGEGMLVGCYFVLLMMVPCTASPGECLEDEEVVAPLALFQRELSMRSQVQTNSQNSAISADRQTSVLGYKDTAGHKTSFYRQALGRVGLVTKYEVGFLMFVLVTCAFAIVWGLMCLLCRPEPRRSAASCGPRFRYDSYNPSRTWLNPEAASEDAAAHGKAMYRQVAWNKSATAEVKSQESNVPGAESRHTDADSAEAFWGYHTSASEVEPATPVRYPSRAATQETVHASPARCATEPALRYYTRETPATPALGCTPVVKQARDDEVIHFSAEDMVDSN